MAATIKDIARLANVSHSTVSRALRGHPAISADTITLIRRIAAEVGYVPSAAARSLKTNRSLIIGVVVERIADPFFAEVLDGIQDVLGENGYSLFVSSRRVTPEQEEASIQTLIEQRIDGVMITSTFVSKESYSKLQAAGIPTVLIHNHGSDEFRYSLYHDDFYGGKVMTHHLIDLNHIRIAYIGAVRGGRSSKQRLAGYRAALEEAGLPFREEYVVMAKDTRLETGLNAALELMSLPQPPTALFCYNDLLAIGAIRGVQDSGQSVPHDISVAGFDNISLAGYVMPALTTFDQPKYYLGTQAAQMMLRLMYGEADDSTMPSEVVLLRGRLVVRESTQARA